MPARHFLTLKTAVSFGLVWPVTLHTKSAHGRPGSPWTLSPPTPSGSVLPRVVLPGESLLLGLGSRDGVPQESPGLL